MTVECAHSRRKLEHGDQEDTEFAEFEPRKAEADVDQHEDRDRGRKLIEVRDRRLVARDGDLGVGVLADCGPEVFEQFRRHPEELHVADPLRSGLNGGLDALVRLGNARANRDGRLDADPKHDRDRPENPDCEPCHQRCDIQHDGEIHSDQKQSFHGHHALLDYLPRKPGLGNDRVEDVVGTLVVEVADACVERALEGARPECCLVLRGEPCFQPRDDEGEGIPDRHHCGDADEEKAEFERNAEEIIHREERI